MSIAFTVTQTDDSVGATVPEELLASLKVKGGADRLGGSAALRRRTGDEGATIASLAAGDIGETALAAGPCRHLQLR